MTYLNIVCFENSFYCSDRFISFMEYSLLLGNPCKWEINNVPELLILDLHEYHSLPVESIRGPEEIF